MFFVASSSALSDMVKLPFLIFLREHAVKIEERGATGWDRKGISANASNCRKFQKVSLCTAALHATFLIAHLSYFKVDWESWEKHEGREKSYFKDCFKDYFKFTILLLLLFASHYSIGDALIQQRILTLRKVFYLRIPFLDCALHMKRGCEFRYSDETQLMQFPVMLQNVDQTVNFQPHLNAE